MSEDQALDVLRAALDADVTFIDTADVYGDGRSETLIGRLLAERGSDGCHGGHENGPAGRTPHVPEAYTLNAFRVCTDGSRRNLGVETLDLVQLHCPPTPVYDDDRVFDALDTLVAEQRISAYGVSVEDGERGAARDRPGPGVATVQIILSVRAASRSSRCSRPRSRPAWGSSHGCRWPAGCCPAATTSTPPSPPMITAATTSASAWPASWPGAPSGAARPAQLALCWVVDQPGVSTVIPGARSAEQARSNAAAARLAPLAEDLLGDLAQLYDRDVREHVHSRW